MPDALVPVPAAILAEAGDVLHAIIAYLLATAETHPSLDARILRERAQRSAVALHAAAWLAESALRDCQPSTPDELHAWSAIEAEAFAYARRMGWTGEKLDATLRALWHAKPPAWSTWSTHDAERWTAGELGRLWLAWSVGTRRPLPPPEAPRASFPGAEDGDALDRARLDEFHRAGSKPRTP